MNKRLLLSVFYALLIGGTVFADTWQLLTDAASLQAGD